MKYLNKPISLILCLFMLAALFAGCGGNESGNNTEPAEPEIILADLGENVEIHTATQNAFLIGGDYTSTADYAIGELELSRPLPVSLSWSVSGADVSPEKYLVRISENEDMSGAREIESESTVIRVFNLKVRTTYYWTVTAVYGTDPAGAFTSQAKSFTVSSCSPRNLYVDGATNVRDLGGWKTESGKTVRQGVIFRGGKISDYDSDGVYATVTEQGEKAMLEDLGIRTEIDLRRTDIYENGGQTESVLGEGVKYYCCPMIAEGNLIEIDREPIKAVFDLLADEENYPIYFHCAIGTDRTGCISFLLLGLLGVEREDLCCDYLFSNFGEIGGSRDLTSINNYVSRLSLYDGERLSDRIRGYLISVGMTEEQLDSIVSTMLDD